MLWFMTLNTENWMPAMTSWIADTQFRTISSLLEADQRRWYIAWIIEKFIQYYEARKLWFHAEIAAVVSDAEDWVLVLMSWIVNIYFNKMSSFLGADERRWFVDRFADAVNDYYKARHVWCHVIMHDFSSYFLPRKSVRAQIIRVSVTYHWFQPNEHYCRGCHATLGKYIFW